MSRRAIAIQRIEDTSRTIRALTEQAGTDQPTVLQLECTANLLDAIAAALHAKDDLRLQAMLTGARVTAERQAPRQYRSPDVHRVPYTPTPTPSPVSAADARDRWEKDHDE